LRQHGTGTRGWVALLLRERQVLDIERDIRSTVIGMRVPKVTHGALSQ